MNRRGFLSFLISAPLTASLPWAKIANVIRPIAPSVSWSIDLELADIIAKTIASRREALLTNIMANNALLKRMRQSRVVKAQRKFNAGDIVEKLRD